MSPFTYTIKHKQGPVDKLKSQSGLTIVESLVAISILVISVLGPLVIVSQALRTSFFARDQLTTYYLAQEAIEHIRNLRDRNSLRETDHNAWLKDITFLTGINTPEVSPTINAINEPNPVKYRLIRDGGYRLELCPSNDCGKLTLDTVTGVYGEVTSTNQKQSIYTREVVFYQAPGDITSEQEVNIEVTLKWNQVGGTYKFKLRENLLNWKIQKFQ
jgi:type II secretory pathway pseudopilin PulG